MARLEIKIDDANPALLRFLFVFRGTAVSTASVVLPTPPALGTKEIVTGRFLSARDAAAIGSVHLLSPSRDDVEHFARAGFCRCPVGPTSAHQALVVAGRDFVADQNQENLIAELRGDLDELIKVAVIPGGRDHKDDRRLPTLRS